VRRIAIMIIIVYATATLTTISEAGRPVRFRFQLTNGSLYSFWISPNTSGASGGYIGAGGPGFTGSTETVGKGFYKSEAS